MGFHACASYSVFRLICEDIFSRLYCYCILANRVYFRKSVYDGKNTVLNTLFDQLCLSKISNFLVKSEPNNEQWTRIRYCTSVHVERSSSTDFLRLSLFSFCPYITLLVPYCWQMFGVRSHTRKPNPNVYCVHANAVEALRRMRFHYTHNRTHSHINNDTVPVHFPRSLIAPNWTKWKHKILSSSYIFAMHFRCPQCNIAIPHNSVTQQQHQLHCNSCNQSCVCVIFFW